MIWEYSFEGDIEQFPGKGGWVYVRVPEKFTDHLKEQRVAWGMYPIRATVGRSIWETKLMMMKGGRFFVALKSSVRKSENLVVGDSVFVSVVVLEQDD